MEIMLLVSSMEIGFDEGGGYSCSHLPNDVLQAPQGPIMTLMVILPNFGGEPQILFLIYIGKLENFWELAK